MIFPLDVDSMKFYGSMETFSLAFFSFSLFVTSYQFIHINCFKRYFTLTQTMIYLKTFEMIHFNWIETILLAVILQW